MSKIPATFRNEWPDRTKRACEEINIHYHALGREAAGQWVAIRLSDGGSDGHLYGSKMEATRFQLHEHQCAYICLPPMGEMSLKEVHRFLEVNEMAYDAGGRLEDAGTHIVPRGLF